MKRDPQTTLQPPARAGSAFSLLEVLVVMAIIGLLAALLLPSLGRARVRAFDAQCSSHLRQLGLAARLYWDDHQDRFFPYSAGFINGGVLYWFGWMGFGPEGGRAFDSSQGALHPYLKGRGVEVCPALDYAFARFKLKAAGAAYGYGYNLHLTRPPSQPALKTHLLPRPANTALFADAAQVNTFQAPASPANPLLEEFYYVNSEEPTAHFRHRSFARVAFVDGHVTAAAAAPGSFDERLPEVQVGRLAADILMPAGLPSR